MIAKRSVSLMFFQARISASVRRQPTQISAGRCSRHRFTQGLLGV
jgi:hypothetical protein